MLLRHFAILSFSLSVATSLHAQEIRLDAPVMQGSKTFTGESHTLTTSVRGFDWSEVASVPSSVTPMTAQAQSLAAGQNSLVLGNFPGPVDSTVPDPAMATGPHHVIATVNQAIVIYDKSGNQMSRATLSAFMGVFGTPFDTSEFYDQTTGRFFVLTTDGRPLLAVSDTSDPTGHWHVFVIPGSRFAVDAPKMGISSNAVVLNYIEEGTPGSCPALVVGLAGLLSGASTLDVTRFDSVFGSPGACPLMIPAQNYQPSNLQYLVQLNGSSSLDLATFDTSAKPAQLTLSMMNIPAYTFQPTVTQAGSSLQINIVPGIDSAVVRNGSLWCNHTVKGANGSAVVRWYQVDPVGQTVQQTGDIAGTGEAWMGAVAVRPDNSMDMVYTTVTSSTFPSAGYAHRDASDPAGTTPISGVYMAGQAPSKNSRWGDFFQTSVDGDGTVWGIAQYWNTTTYGTQIVHLGSATAIAQLTVNINPQSATISRGSSTSFDVTASGTNLTAPITFACSGLPNGATCSFSPATLNSSGTTKLTISVPAKSAMLDRGTMLLAAFAAILFLGLFSIQRDSSRRHLLTLLSITLVAISIVACSGGTPAPPVAPTPTPQPESQNVTVTAASGGTQASTLVTLTVQ